MAVTTNGYRRPVPAHACGIGSIGCAACQTGVVCVSSHFFCVMVGFYLGLGVRSQHTEFMQFLTNQGPALRAPRAARVAGASPSIPYGDSALLPAGLSALRLALRVPLARAFGTGATLRACRLAGYVIATAPPTQCPKPFKSAPSQPVRPAQTTPSFVSPFSLIRDHSQVKSGAPTACKGALRRVLTRSVLAFGSAPHAASAPALASCLASAKPVARAKELTKDGSAGKQDTSQRRSRKPGLQNLRIRQF